MIYNNNNKRFTLFIYGGSGKAVKQTVSLSVVYLFPSFLVMN